MKDSSKQPLNLLADEIGNQGLNTFNLEDFEKTPHTYKRTTLKAVYSEALATVKTVSLDVDVEESFSFDTPVSELLTGCSQTAMRWVKVPTHFPEVFEQEYLLVFIGSNI